jgi:type II restriction/modification system DNA methylase subunit YeeA
MLPLNREWDAIQVEAAPYLQVFLDFDSTPRDEQLAYESLIPLYERMMDKLGSTTVLDPACGSGNFLYMSLRLMKDLEGRVRKLFEPLALPFRDVVSPRQFYGIEKDEFAANLAHVVIWIGYLQWRFENEGELHPKLPNKPATPYDLPSPILKDKDSPDEPERILNADAIMRYDADGKPYEPEWVAADVIVGNPPFLGDKRMRGELGDNYVTDVRKLYRERVPGRADLVTFWFEKARAEIEHSRATRSGLLATNSIRGGANREVLKRIKSTGDIFLGWSDRGWVLDGASVRVSIVGFDNGSEQVKQLDNNIVFNINPDLTPLVDVTKARVLETNASIAFLGDTKNGAFDITNDVAQKMVTSRNPNARNNQDVVKQWVNGSDITGRPRNMWIVDFGVDTRIETAQLYEAPFRYIERYVYPKRMENSAASLRETWWLHERTRPEFRAAVAKLNRYLITPRVAKHRLFVWLEPDVIPDSATIAVARDDDYFFGALHSYVHELWSLRQGTWLGVGNDPRYTPTTTFETFPFPCPPGQEDTESPHYQAISTAAKQLNDERELWLNPPDLVALGASEKLLKDRTLTNLYNAVVAYREGKLAPSKENPAAAFAPRLAALHAALDRAVLAAYGWSDLANQLRTPEGDEELLRRLLELNLKRAQKDS